MNGVKEDAFLTLFFNYMSTDEVNLHKSFRITPLAEDEARKYKVFCVGVVGDEVSNPL